jgi:hypothetical protein
LCSVSNYINTFESCVRINMNIFNIVRTVHRIKSNLHSQFYMHSVCSTNVRMFRHIAGAIIRELLPYHPRNGPLHKHRFARAHTRYNSVKTHGYPKQTLIH